MLTTNQKGWITKLHRRRCRPHDIAALTGLPIREVRQYVRKGPKRWTRTERTAKRLNADKALIQANFGDVL